MWSVFIKSLNAQKCLFEYLREPRENERYCAEVTHSNTQYYTQYLNQFNARNLMPESVGRYELIPWKYVVISMTLRRNMSECMEKSNEWIASAHCVVGGTFIIATATATATATVVDSHAPLEVFSTVLTATRQHTGIHNYNMQSYRRWRTLLDRRMVPNLDASGRVRPFFSRYVDEVRGWHVVLVLLASDFRPRKN